MGARAWHQVCERHYKLSTRKLVRVARMDPTRPDDKEAAVGGPTSDVCPHGEGEPRVPADPIEAAHVTSDHVQGLYTDTQVKAILAHVDSVPPSVTDRAYVTRLRAFIRLLLDSGCDVSDALQFGQLQIEKMRTEKRDVWVFRYKRQKTKQQAVIPITAELAKMLRHLPLEQGVSQDVPFRIRGISLKAAQNRWSRRVQYAISAAKVTHVDLPDGRKNQRT